MRKMRSSGVAKRGESREIRTVLSRAFLSVATSCCSCMNSVTRTSTLFIIFAMKEVRWNSEVSTFIEEARTKNDKGGGETLPVLKNLPLVLEREDIGSDQTFVCVLVLLEPAPVDLRV